MNRFVLVPVDPPEDIGSTWPPRREQRLDLERLLGPIGWQHLPAAVQRRFAKDHTDAQYIGRIDLHCSRAGRVYAMFASLFGGPLTSLRAIDLATTVTVRADHRGGVIWERCFGDEPGAASKRVRSTKRIGAHGQLIEQTDGGLAMQLDVFEEDAALVFLSRRYFFKVGRYHVGIPALLTPGVCRVEHHDLGHRRFRFTLSMTHPLLGVTFRQSGVFHDPKEIAS